MKKTDIGVVAFVYAVALFFLSMTLKLPKPAQAYPLFIIVLLLGLTTLYVAQNGHRMQRKKAWRAEWKILRIFCRSSFFRFWP